jgi:hypothetical protein
MQQLILLFDLVWVYFYVSRAQRVARDLETEESDGG